MNNIYCTYFNQGYLNRGIVLFRSMERHVPDFRLEVLCFDDATYDFLTQHSFSGVTPVRLDEFERRHPELIAIKPTRSRGEYFFTCTSTWTLDVINRHPEAESVTYLDADTKFFSSPSCIFEQMRDKDIMICSHNFERDAEKFQLHGKYNVGWLTFRNSNIGLDCLSRWAADCISWCYDRLEDGKFADQKYLDSWPARYGDRLAIAPKGLDLGPWGIGKGELNNRNGQMMIRDSPLILYHYQGLRLFSKRHYYLGYYYHHSVRPILELLYEPYIRELVAVAHEFGIQECLPSKRYSSGSLLYRLFTGYWLDHTRLADMQRRIQSLFR